MHATVRDPAAAPTRAAYLLTLPGAEKRLNFFQASVESGIQRILLRCCVPCAAMIRITVASICSHRYPSAIHAKLSLMGMS